MSARVESLTPEKVSRASESIDWSNVSSPGYSFFTSSPRMAKAPRGLWTNKFDLPPNYNKWFSSAYTIPGGQFSTGPSFPTTTVYIFGSLHPEYAQRKWKIIQKFGSTDKTKGEDTWGVCAHELIRKDATFTLERTHINVQEYVAEVERCILKVKPNMKTKTKIVENMRRWDHVGTFNYKQSHGTPWPLKVALWTINQHGRDSDCLLGFVGKLVQYLSKKEEENAESESEEELEELEDAEGPNDAEEDAEEDAEHEEKKGKSKKRKSAAWSSLESDTDSDSGDDKMAKKRKKLETRLKSVFRDIVDMGKNNEYILSLEKQLYDQKEAYSKLRDQLRQQEDIITSMAEKANEMQTIMAGKFDEMQTIMAEAKKRYS